MNKHQIWHVLVNREGKFHPAGRVLVHNGQLRHLEDYHNLIDIPEGPITHETAEKMANRTNGTRVVSDDDWRNGHHPDLIPPAQLEPLWKEEPKEPEAVAQKPGVWHYRAQGHTQGHTLQSHGNGKFTLDGNALEPDEVQGILKNIRSKTASLRYKEPALDQTIKKYAQFFLDLKKQDIDPQLALEHLDRLHENADPQTKSAIASLRKQIFEDPMVPGLGNKYSFEQHKLRGEPGHHVVADANWFKGINDKYGHEAGDQAIKAFGGAWRDAANETGDVKAARIGGDEFHLHAPTSEHAHTFVRNLRSKLETMPSVGGEHRLSMSLGMGPSFHEADQDLYEAKKGKLGHTPATIPHLLTSKTIPQPTLAPTALTAPPVTPNPPALAPIAPTPIPNPAPPKTAQA